MGKRRNRSKYRQPVHTGPRVYESAAPEPMGDPVTFTLDGREYLCRELGPLELSEMARMQGLSATNPRAIAFMSELFETLLGTEQYQEFRIRCGQFQTKPEMFVAIIEGIFEDFSNRPTGPQSDSSTGSENTNQRLTQDSSSQAMEILHGRPDLQMAVELAEEKTRKIPRNILSAE